MILRQWRIPWEIEEVLENIKGNILEQNVRAMHTVREGNSVVYSLDNEVEKSQDKGIL